MGCNVKGPVCQIWDLYVGLRADGAEEGICVVR